MSYVVSVVILLETVVSPKPSDGSSHIVAANIAELTIRRIFDVIFPPGCDILSNHAADKRRRCRPSELDSVVRSEDEFFGLRPRTYPARRRPLMKRLAKNCQAG